MAASVLLEGLQALTPDRTANLVAALCGAGGVLAATLVAELFIRAWRWRLKSARGDHSAIYTPGRLMPPISLLSCIDTSRMSRVRLRTRLLGLLVSALAVGAAIAVWRPRDGVGYVEIKTVPLAPVTQMVLYIDGTKLAPIKAGSAIGENPKLA